MDIEGDIVEDEKVLDEHSHDTSLFEIRPKKVVYPKNTSDLEKIVKYAMENNIPFAGRSAGTDMTGGPLTDSIVLSFTKYMNHFSVDGLSAEVEPGVYYRDFEMDDIELPTYPASKSICALGGMIMNNSGGEKTLRYGQTKKYVEEMDMTLSDGNTYTFKKLSKEELEEKKGQDDFEGEIYRKMHKLLDDNYDLIQSKKPKVSKNSSGYYLWDVWNKETFDLTQLFCGSQGTLGLLSKAKVRLVEKKKHEKLVVLFFKDWKALPQVVKEILPIEPEGLETFDDATLKLGLRFMPKVAKKAGESFFRFAFRFIPEFFIGIKMFGLPKLVVLIQLAEDDKGVLDNKVRKIKETLSDNNVWIRVSPNKEDANKYWTMRRESFNLLRQNVKGKRTAPFIDDFCVSPEKIPEFLPKAIKLLEDSGIEANITGHAGSGNLHIIPLMDFSKNTEREKIVKISDQFYDLVVEYGGSITAEHNDGIIRTPYLEKMFGSDMVRLFKEVKNIFDPKNLFNPGKKVDGDKSNISKYMVKEN
ncbi:MAG: FAD-binding oxidoreductase [Candidatus Pacebacteria bacterium]|nr:FAD-binding oxidoreductase [Candidatus Paceibacterota bacterium]